MNTQEKIAVMQAFTEGNPIQFKVKTDYTSKWYSFKHSDEPGWNWEICEYRIAVVDDYIDWSHVHPSFNYMARDKDGGVWLFTEKPVIAGIIGWSRAPDDFEPARSAKTFMSFKEGNKDWTESLVMRDVP